ncbi:uncharacterized protein TRAVEDRAFT_22277 [Trametes versicolor FP-101664 SS1]|uniref:uncharacterized protein n=1 Tax=Trametes versicolor (strain FP-101664) TaxID=717944 RepID=UPI0004622A34|nr:uncharacterized protein TRAVEDRAFT_22277 [Trametes versicolor FP-101664 SS1]EIW55854.1 hypothetical protein TRAVEDRAFT_22277 [Trametes versicolor FP-101664 SS1]
MTLSDAPLSFEQPITVNTHSKAYSEGDNHSRECAMLRYVYVNVVDDKEGELGTLRALQIHRDTHHEYLEALDVDSREMYEFATTLFDESGDFRSELMEDDYLRGTGVWGRELDNDAPLLYINSIHVEKKHRRRGIASLLLQTLAQSEYTTPQTFIFVCPVPSFEQDTYVAWRKQTPTDAALYRKNHYRRVGRTKYLAYAPNPGHRSRLLAVEDDVECLNKAFHHWPSQTDSASCAANAWLHRMIESTAQPSGLSTEDVADAIREAYRRDPALIRQKDNRGFALIHTAANAANLRAIQALLALPSQSGVVEDALCSMENQAERTAVELCEHYMLNLKHHAQTLPDQQWNGHSPDALRCEILLKNAEGFGMITLSEEAYIASRKWGCTCERCTDGWLSERMRYRMLHGAEVDADIMDTIAETAHRGAHFDKEFAAQHLPPAVRSGGVTKLMFQDYADVVRVIGLVLRQPGTAGIPSVDNVRHALGGLGKRFFAKGGRIEHALNYVLHGAKAQSPWGDNLWDALQEGLAMEGDTNAIAYKAMRECDNDLEFALVRQRLGLPQTGHFTGKYVTRADTDGWEGDDECMTDDGGDTENEDDAMLDEDRESLCSLAHARIDRHGLVARFNPVRTASSASTPMQVGNGHFAFGADVTGLQTFLPWPTISDLGWKNDSLPAGTTTADIAAYRGVVWDGVEYEFGGPEPEQQWLISNPNRVNLGRVGLLLLNGSGEAANVTEEELEGKRQWEGADVRVQTVVAQESNTVGVTITSPLLQRGRLGVFLDFPWNDGVQKFEAPFVGVWNATSNHTTALRTGGGLGRNTQAQIAHTLDATTFFTSVGGDAFSVNRVSPDAHRYEFVPHQSQQTFAVAISYSPGQSRRHRAWRRSSRSPNRLGVTSGPITASWTS